MISLHDFVKKVYIPKIDNIKNNLTSSFEKYNDLHINIYTDNSNSVCFIKK